MPLVLARREIQIGNQIRVNTLKHGKENVSGLFIPMAGLALTAEELAEVMLEPKAYNYLYRKLRGRPDQPIWSKLSPTIHLDGKVGNVNATLYLGRRQLKVIDGTMAKRALTCNEGGTSHLGFELQCVPELDEAHPIMEALFSRASAKIDIEIECETYGAQPDLPLEQPEDTDEEGRPIMGEDANGAGGDAESYMTGMGRSITAHNKRKERSRRET
jgi:hypothetical protein